jgi:transketolase
MSVTSLSIEQRAINTIRTLSMEAVQQANSGHPGTPMALAPVAYTLFNHVLRYDPLNPQWPARDRFVLSAGHASMLLYSTLHLSGVRQLDHSGQPTEELAVPLDHIRNFRQWESRCPGHPEHGHTSGVETTTGPLGQGIGNSVGMAIAQRHRAARYQGVGFENLWDYNVYAICSDGDLMEGLSSEAASIAGHLKLSNLCWMYDDNQITIEGETSLAFSEDVATRFRGYGWNVLTIADANDVDALQEALATFQKTEDAPTIIIIRSVIAWGAPTKHGTAESHGAPLGKEEVQATKEAYGCSDAPAFYVADEVREHFRQGIGSRGSKLFEQWNARYQQFTAQHPALAEELDEAFHGRLPRDWDADLPTFPADSKGAATRVTSGKVLNAVAHRVPWLLGGSADLAPSTKTLLGFDGAGDLQSGQYAGRNLHFGIREHAMGAILNGMALSGLRPYGATFLVFADYCRPSIRLSAIMKLPTIFIFTHDSIGVGEDGPTHQPVEHLASLRAIPGLMVIRPGDANEVTSAWRAIMHGKEHPAALVLTRQDLPTLDRTRMGSADGVLRGGYVLLDPEEANPLVVLIGTGSELSLCVEAAEILANQGVPARVVSMPCWELFEAQDQTYRDEVLPAGIPARVAVEAGIRQGWDRYLGNQGRFIGMEHFGASAPAAQLFEEYDITVQRIVAEATAVAGGA